MATMVKKTKLAALVAELETFAEKKLKLLAKHEEIFNDYTEIEDEIERVTDALKQEARLQIKEGEPTKVLHDDERLHVSVSQGRRSVVWNFDKAKENWPKDLFSRAMKRELDPKEVMAMIEGGLLPEKLAKKAREDGKLPTPAVTVKINT